jgi:hypothetical protein
MLFFLWSNPRPVALQEIVSIAPAEILQESSLFGANGWRRPASCPSAREEYLDKENPYIRVLHLIGCLPKAGQLSLLRRDL